MKSVVLTVALMTVSPAMAQRQVEAQSGSLIGVPKRARFPEVSGLSAVDRGRVVMAQFARCTVDRSRSRVDRVLAMPIGKAYWREMSALSSPECLAHGGIKFKSDVMRGALFTELWQRKEAEGGVDTALRRVDASADDGGPGQMNAYMLQFADCVIAADRSAVVSVLKAPTASSAQNEAYKSLLPRLGPCFPSGGKLTLSKPILEGVLAEALYRGPAALSDTKAQ